MIPGPKEPKDFNSFLSPIINELNELAGKFFIFIMMLIYKTISN